jgi:signal transduction histidine kinase
MEGMRDTESELLQLAKVDRAMTREQQLIDVARAGAPIARDLVGDARHRAVADIATLDASMREDHDPTELRTIDELTQMQLALEADLDTLPQSPARGVVHGTDRHADLLAAMVARERAELSDEVGEIRETTEIVLLVALAMITLLAVGLSVLVVAPLRRHLAELKHAARTIASGDLSTPVTIEGPEELASLASAIDDMRLDLAKLRLAESERASRAVESADRMASVGLLAAGVAHEIANPMSYVLANLELAATDLSTSAPSVIELRALVADAHDGAERVVSILQDLKTFSRGISVHNERFAVAPVIDQVLKLVGGKARNSARIVRDDEPGQPLASGNDQRVAQVLLNLVMNSVQAFPSRSPDNQITIRSRTRGGGIEIEVEDNGCGIPAEALPRIFDPFFSTKPAGIGTGLGLSVCRNLVSAMGGTIGVESRPGRTVFTVRLASDRSESATESPLRPITRPRSGVFTVQALPVAGVA